MQVDAQEGHGWWPYVVPYVAFLLLSELGCAPAGRGGSPSFSA